MAAYLEGLERFIGRCMCGMRWQYEHLYLEYSVLDTAGDGCSSVDRYLS